MNKCKKKKKNYIKLQKCLWLLNFLLLLQCCSRIFQKDLIFSRNSRGIHAGFQISPYKTSAGTPTVNCVWITLNNPQTSCDQFILELPYSKERSKAHLFWIWVLIKRNVISPTANSNVKMLWYWYQYIMWSFKGLLCSIFLEINA